MLFRSVIVLLGGTALSALKDYTDQRAAGKDPTFKASSIGLKEKTDFWLRVACQDGHMAAVFVKFQEGKKPAIDQIKADWAAFRGPAQELNLPSAPKQFLHYFEEPDRPQTRLDRNLENGMAVSLGRLREDSQYDYKFVGLSHNTLRGAAGGAVLLAELLCAKGYFS